jgi:ATP-dependent Clp protease ATP-binding subunit ClpC
MSDVVSNWTGIPVQNYRIRISSIIKMEDSIHERIGQNTRYISFKAIRRARVGLRNPNRPIASFILLRTNWVGRINKALSEYMFGTEESMIRLDMSEYMEKHTVAKLIGSPPGM